MISTKIQGIPCQVEMTSYSPFRSNRRGHIDNWLPDDPEEIEFTVFDRKGYYAGWLERKMTPQDVCDIEELLLQEAKNDARP